MTLTELRILMRIYRAIKRLEARTMANFDALNARLADLEATEELVLAKIDELRAILESDSEDQAKVDAALAKVGEIEDELQAKVEEKQP